MSFWVVPVWPTVLLLIPAVGLMVWGYRRIWRREDERWRNRAMTQQNAGTCRVCGEPISVEQIEADPDAHWSCEVARRLLVAPTKAVPDADSRGWR